MKHRSLSFLILSVMLIVTIGVSLWLPFRMAVKIDNGYLSISLGKNIARAATDTYSPTSNTSSVYWNFPANAYGDDADIAYTLSSNQPITWGNYGISGSGDITKVRIGADAWAHDTYYDSSFPSDTRYPGGDLESTGTFQLSQIRVPTGVGDTNSAWTPSTGSAETCVDETDWNGAAGNIADYVTSPTAAGENYQLFTFSAFSVPASATIVNVTIWEYIREASSGTNDYDEMIKVGGNRYVTESNRNPGTGNTWYSVVYTTNPKAGGAWTPAQVNGTDGTNDLQQFGGGGDDTNPAFRMNAVYLVVAYTYANNYYANVDEEPVDYNDTIVLTTDSGNNSFLFTPTSAFSLTDGAKQVLNVAVYFYAVDWGVHTAATNVITAYVKAGGSYASSTSSNPGITPSSFSKAFTTNPATGLAWTEADIEGTGANPLQGFGFFSTDGVPDLGVSQILAVVTYQMVATIRIHVDVSWDGGTNWSSQSDNIVTTSEVRYWHDVTSATAWDWTKLNDSNFKVRAQAESTTDDVEFREDLDWLPVEVTYTSGDPEIAVDIGTYDFSTVAVASTTNTTTTHFTIDNLSTMQTDQTIGVTTSNWSGGVQWVHSDTATPGVNQAGLIAQRGGVWGTGNVTVTFANPPFIYENCPATTDYSFGLSLIAPTEFTDGVEKEIIVRITAVAG